MPRLIATCPTCQLVRYRTAMSFESGGPKPRAEDFIPENGQTEGRDDEQPKCSNCNVPLSFLPDVPIKPGVRSQPSSPPPSTDGVQTLFSAQPGEEVKEMKMVSDLKWIVVTSKRIVLVDAEPLVEVMR